MTTQRTSYGMRSACRYCAQDIEFLGRDYGWRDRGAGRKCLPFFDRIKGELVAPKTKHAPPVKRGIL